MKTNTISKSIIAAIAVAAAILAMSSCSNDSPSAFNAAPQQGFGAVTAAGSLNPDVVKQTTHQVGDTVTKHIEGYGDAVFTCISAKAPFYFVHTSYRKYSASEMDAMHYQQNPLAVNGEMFEKVTREACAYTRVLLGKKLQAFPDTKLFLYWSESGLKNFEHTFPTVFHGAHFDIAEVEIRMSSAPYWIRDTNCSYPYSKFSANVFILDTETVDIDPDSHWCYATAESHYLMFAYTE